MKHYLLATLVTTSAWAAPQKATKFDCKGVVDGRAVQLIYDTESVIYVRQEKAYGPNSEMKEVRTQLSDEDLLVESTHWTGTRVTFIAGGVVDQNEHFMTLNVPEFNVQNTAGKLSQTKVASALLTRITAQSSMKGSDMVAGQIHTFETFKLECTVE